MVLDFSYTVCLLGLLTMTVFRLRIVLVAQRWLASLSTSVYLTSIVHAWWFTHHICLNPSDFYTLYRVVLFTVSVLLIPP